MHPAKSMPEGYEQMNLFNEAEASADAETEELFEEIRPSSYKRKKEKRKEGRRSSNFETVETRTYKLEGEARYCPECGKKIQRSNKGNRKNACVLYLQSLRLKKRSLMYTAVRNAGP